MHYEIDQSGKIEDTSKPTVIALVSLEGNQRTIVIPASLKRKLQELYRKSGQSKLFIFHTFSIGVFILIRHIKEKSFITIDNEYPKKDKIIITVLETLLTTYKKPVHELSISQIGNHPLVHYAARDVYLGKKKPDEVVTIKHLYQIKKKADGCIRACLSTLVNTQSRSFYLEYTSNKKYVKHKYQKKTR